LGGARCGVWLEGVEGGEGVDCGELEGCWVGGGACGRGGGCLGCPWVGGYGCHGWIGCAGIVCVDGGGRGRVEGGRWIERGVVG